MDRPDFDAERPPAGIPGTFVAPELAEECAEFLAETKRTILRKQELGLLPEARAEVLHDLDAPRLRRGA